VKINLSFFLNKFLICINHDRKLAKISLVTPSFNQAQFLEATIESPITNYQNLEYILLMVVQQMEA